MEALDTGASSTHTAGWAGSCMSFGQPHVAIVPIPSRRPVVRRAEVRIVGEHLLGGAYPSGGLDTPNTFRRERAREPVERRERSSVIEEWWHSDDHRKIEVATLSHVDQRPWRSSNLRFDDAAIIHPGRRRSR